MKIAIDAMGGDRAPDVVMHGASLALKEYPDLSRLYLVGNESTLKPLAEKYSLPAQRIELIHTDEVVEMHESGAKMLRKKKKASISLATGLVKSGDADAVIGAGNTGAAVANATIRLRMISGVERAGIASPLPNEFGLCNLLDAGANPEPKPSNLVDYAIMGAVYARHVQGKQRPKVGVMSNGEEEGKGTEFTREAHRLLKELTETHDDLPFEYLGYVEGRDLFLSDLQVCLTDGFTGNVVLKTAEGVAKGMSQWMREEFKKSPVTMMGALLGKKAFGAVRKRTSHEQAGGSPLLGVNGICIIGHGSSTSVAIMNAIRVARESVIQRINPKIEEIVAQIKS